ncbi:MAG: ABC transporter permease [Sphaerochaetaceae bacterium]|nr:ABC transporter permease [Spirochaetales bacterium]MDY5499262.1 ABC transporter permease [Sphaerochaetaceae bacterium]
MFRYVLKRLVLMIPVILVTSLLIYFAMSLTGGDPAVFLAPENATDAQIQQIRVDLGLTDSFPVRYLKYMAGMLHGDLGTSYVTKRDVFRTFIERLPNTMQLAGASVLIATLIALPLGIYTAIHENTWKDTLGMIFALFGVSMPNFWLGLMLIIVFSLKLKWFPSGGKSGPLSLVLPALTVGLGLAALITRTTRSSMLDVIRQDYIRTARAKGCSEKRVIRRHALPNALIPIITVIGMQLSNVMTGSVLAESVFSWPGIGRLIFESISKRDTPMVTGSIIMCSILMVLINLLVDIVYAFFDPRIKAQYTHKG